MSEEKDFQQRVQRIGALVGEIEQIADPAVRASTIQLVKLVMEFHGAGLDRALEILARSGEAGIEMVEELGRDPMVSSLLVLHGLHPDNLETRVTRAVEHLEPKLRRDGALFQLLDISQEGAVRVRITLGSHSCSSTTKALQATVEDAIYEAAPDISSLSVEGLEGKLASGFVPVDNLRGQVPADPGVRTSTTAGMATQYGD